MTPEEKTKLSNKIDVLNKLLASTNNKDDEFMYNYFIRKYTRQLEEKTFIGDLPPKEREIVIKERKSKKAKELYQYKISWGGNEKYNNNLLKIDINLFQ